MTMGLYLLEGPLMGLIESRRDLIESMAQTLIREGIPKDDKMAARQLFNCGYDFENSALLADEALYLAKQEMIAREMSGDAGSRDYWKSRGAFTGLKLLKGGKP